MQADYKQAREVAALSRRAIETCASAHVYSPDGDENLPEAQANRRTTAQGDSGWEATEGERCRSADSGDSCGAAGAGWSPEELTVVSRLRRECMKEAAAQGAGREAALQLLAAALPHKTLADIKQLENR